MRITQTSYTGEPKVSSGHVAEAITQVREIISLTSKVNESLSVDVDRLKGPQLMDGQSESCEPTVGPQGELGELLSLLKESYRLVVRTSDISAQISRI